MRAHFRFRVCLLALALVHVAACTDPTQSTGALEQATINPPLPNGPLILNAKNTLTIGQSTQVFGDVASSGANGVLVFDVGAFQIINSNAMANTVKVRAGASVGQVFGNDITVEGTVQLQILGLDPAALPQVPSVTAGSPGTSNISVATHQAKQACPGRYGTISLAANATLNLNGGVYQVNRLSLGEGARLEPSEPVVILVSGNMVTSAGAVILPSDQAVVGMTAADIRIEVAGSITIGGSSEVQAHLLAPGGKITTGDNVTLTGAAWARNITIGAQNLLFRDGEVSQQTPAVPPPCNDVNACTADQCVTSGTIAFCRNTPLPSGTSCEDGEVCNGAEVCDAVGGCQPGTPVRKDTSCSDGDACNGDERCDGFGGCLPGPPPPVNDSNSCTIDACDPVSGVSHDPLRDGVSCLGTGICEGGACSIPGVAFSELFFAGLPSPSQCDGFHAFASQLTASSYSSVKISGSFDLRGLTCDDPLGATQICQAIHNSAPTSVFCNGHTWNVGDCGAHLDLSLDIIPCVCNFGAGHSLRPCIGNENWGGVNTSTCGATSQFINVICE